MARLRATVSLALSAQEFLLDAPVITIGKLPDSVLVLPFAWVGATHLIISDDPSGGIRVKAPSELRKAELSGLPISTEGLLVRGDQPFDILIFSPANDPLTLRFEPAPVAVLSPQTQALLASPRAGRSHKVEIGVGAAVLVGATVLISYLAFSSAAIPRGSGELSSGQVESRRQLEAAASAYVSGDLSAARHALTMTGETGVVPDALSLAVKRAQQASEAPRPPVAAATAPRTEAAGGPSTGGPAPVAVAPAEPKDDRIVFEGKLVTPAQKEQILAARAAEAAAAKQRADADRAANAKALAEQSAQAEAARQLDAANAEVSAGKTFKETSLASRAIAHAKELVRAQLGSDVEFPKDSDARVVVKPDGYAVTVRGFCDQMNAQKVPLRIFYMARMLPASEGKWAGESVEMIK